MNAALPIKVEKEKTCTKKCYARICVLFSFSFFVIRRKIKLTIVAINKAVINSINKRPKLSIIVKLN